MASGAKEAEILDYFYKDAIIVNAVAIFVDALNLAPR